MQALRRPALSLAFAVTAAALLSAAEPPARVPSSEIPAYTLVRPGLAAAGQPTPDALRKLKEMGFKTVVNLRTEAEGTTQAERQEVEALGLRYVSVPVSPQTFSRADVEAVRKVLDDPAAGPVLLHCGSANRVGAVLGVIEADKGVTLEAAEAEAKRAGLSSPAMIDAFRRVAAEPRKP
jgi:uncharacterized protein (TIGR01244 family)